MAAKGGGRTHLSFPKQPLWPVKAGCPVTAPSGDRPVPCARRERRLQHHRLARQTHNPWATGEVGGVFTNDRSSNSDADRVRISLRYSFDCFLQKIPTCWLQQKPELSIFFSRTVDSRPLFYHFLPPHSKSFVFDNKLCNLDSYADLSTADCRRCIIIMII